MSYLERFIAASLVIILFTAGMLLLFGCGTEVHTRHTPVYLPQPVVVPRPVNILLPTFVWPTTVVCDGNSLTFGSESDNPDTDSYPSVLQRLLPANYIIYNTGVSGRDTELQAKDAPTDVDTLYTPGADNLLISWEGINSFRGPHDTADQAIEAMRDYVLARQARGFYVVVMTTIPFPQDGSAAYVQFTSEYNTRLLAGATEANAVIDLSEAIDIWDGSQHRTPDGHLNTEGYRLLAEFLAPKIQAWEQQ